ncbi:VOC family protein [Methylibium sp.]|uniref:VOC family protein n=1 Tax=Methylibium sp. TaxID=2067992 RepID=UPI003D0ADEE7
MAKLIHTMIRVFELERSLRFYAAVLDMKESHRLDFPEFTLVYLRAAEGDFEIELTLNKGREDEYSHGTGYGHVAVVVPDVSSKRAQVEALGYAPTAVKEFKRGDELLAKFFFVQDPDGYKIEVLEQHGHYR